MTETDIEEGFSKVEYGITHSKMESMGEREVRNNLNSGTYGEPGNKIHSYVSSWLKDVEFARLEAREEETLSIDNKALEQAEEANIIARSQANAAWRAARYAMYAVIIATILAITTNKDKIFSLIF